MKQMFIVAAMAIATLIPVAAEAKGANNKILEGPLAATAIQISPAQLRRVAESMLPRSTSVEGGGKPRTLG